MIDAFADFVLRATDQAYGPYPYQEQLAAEGFPQVLRVPTGAGKTMAAVLPWMWRRNICPEETPRRLVYVLPLRGLVEQTVGHITTWLSRVGMSNEVGVHVLMGGVDRDDSAWQSHLEKSAILVGTQDMVLSRALMRGYAEPRPRWPISFALLHTDTQWVFDETQLLGPALPTSIQLQAFRDRMGTATPTATMWMSATLSPEDIATIDHDPATRVMELSAEDRDGPLKQRLDATRTVRRLSIADDSKRYPAEVADALVKNHREGTRTIGVFNTVDRAVAVYEQLLKAAPDADLLLVHSRFRPVERRVAADRLAAELSPAGQIVVTTQVLEAGIDISSRTLFTEAAPWSSVVQRAGRCNRAGEYGQGQASLLWAQPPAGRATAAPYDEGDLAETAAALTSLEGQAVTSTHLQDHPVKQAQALYPLLRRRDLLDLFDTMPDLTGNDIDVTPWIRDAEDRTLFVAWRRWTDGPPGKDELFPHRDELCPAPINNVRDLVTGKQTGKNQMLLWAQESLSGEWRRARSDDLHPGCVLLADATKGGYDAALGWAPRSGAPVMPVAEMSAAEEPGNTLPDDSPSFRRGRWVTLLEHLGDVDREVASLAEELAPLPGLTPTMIEAAILAGRYHDLGKAHPVFQTTLTGADQKTPEADILNDGDHVEVPTSLWAKSPHRSGRHSRRYFRHELVSALMLLHPGCRLLDDAAEPDLVAYLAAAHHGKVRISVRSVGDESGDDPPRILGVQAGDLIPAVQLPDGGKTPEIILDPAMLLLGGENGRTSWANRVLKLRDRPDLGPFRVAFLETLVRVADWRASATYDMPAAAEDAK